MLASKITYPGHGLIQLNKVSTNDEGVYSCEVSNIYGSLLRYFHVTVEAGKE